MPETSSTSTSTTKVLLLQNVDESCPWGSLKDDDDEVMVLAEFLAG
jgi:hypothetical protein